ncbi:MAG: DNA topoisomerase, partial [Acidobacteriota bacterium]|nr:DNA topoisomerase [Acidobacteriota bacterium]
MRGLHQAAKIRAQADWLLGLNCTRAFTLHHGVLCTVGRVQTPTPAMVAERQQAAAAFKPAPFWEVTTDLHGLTFKVVTPEKNHFIDKAEAENKLALAGREVTVTVFDQTRKEVLPPQLFDLAALQVEAGKRLNLTAAETLELAQRLYEAQAVSYPRTETRHLSQNMVPELPKILAGCPKDLQAWVPDEVKPPGTRFVDDERLTDHHAIIPTGFPCHDEDAEALFLLIWQRFLAMFAEAKVELETIITVQTGPDSLTFKGKLIQAPGWSAVAGKDTEDEENPAVDIEAFAQGQTHALGELKLVEGKTKPPKPYTDGSLISAMKHVGRTIDDAEPAAHMHGGLGTAATRAEIIEKLLRTDLMTRQKKALVVTD